MTVVLGIDTGGTYTDSVIYDKEKEELINKNKALTTHHNLTEGIISSIEGLKKEWFDRVELVALSTTLATNAIVEGNGARVGIILLGYDQELMEQFALDQEIPAEKKRVVKGRFNIKGEEIEKLDEDQIRKIGQRWQNEIDVFAVSGYMSVRNSAHEIITKKILKEVTSLPVVCGHTLTNQLNSIKRATTVALNASLIPIIENLNQKIKDVLKTKNIKAPLMIVKGDGSLVKDEVILKRPIETILSGPAASTVGAKDLSQIDSGLIVDIGGTTTDISLIKNGHPKLNPKGAIIEGWLSSIEAIEFRTSGLGGDSQIYFNKEGELIIGPKRVIPYSVAADKYKGISKELTEVEDNNLGSKEREFLILNRIPKDIVFNKREERLINLLKSGPKSLLQLTQQLDLVSPQFLKLQRLERLQIIKRIGLTPTDILHVLGEYEVWNREAAEIGFKSLISQFEVDKDNFAIKIKEEITQKGARQITNYLISQEYEDYEQEKCDLCEKILGSSLKNKFENFNWSFQSKLPIIAIGAPAKAYFKELGKYLNNQVIIPKNYEVANAIGAAVGNVVVNEEVLVKPNPMKGNYIVYSKKEKQEFVVLDEAISYAKEIGQKIAINKIKTAGAKDWKTNLEVKRKEVGLNPGFGGTLIEIKVEFTVIGSPY